MEKKGCNGYFLALDISIEDTKLTLITIYAPNKDTPFFKEIFNVIENFENNKFILCGDFNLIMDPDKDCFNYVHVNNPRARKILLEFKTKYYLVDVYRELNPESKRFTWRRKNLMKPARLDFLFI